MQGTQLEKELCGQGLKIIKRNGERTVYGVESAGGKGRMTALTLFPGVELVFNDFHTSNFSHMMKPLPNIMEINYCCKGRFECEFRQGTYAYLGEGDLAVNMLGNQVYCPCFPLGIYQGITIFVDTRLAQDRLARIMDGVAVDLEALREKLCPQDRCLVLKAPPNIEPIFTEIYEVNPQIEASYLRLKVLELLLLLSVLPESGPRKISPYFPADQVQKVKHIRKRLACCLDKEITLKELAAEHEISLTGLKNCFKAVYGKTVYAYRREYRMQAATVMLRESTLSIAEIAGRVGYENPGKFSAAFKAIMGAPPGTYRKNSRPFGAAGAFQSGKAAAVSLK